MTARPVRLGLLAVSPVYYQVPLYRVLAADSRLDFTAIFASNAGVRPFDGGYGSPVAWDIDLLGGYRHLFLKNAERNPIEGSFGQLHDFDVIRVIRDGRFEVLWVMGYNYLTLQLAVVTQRLRGFPILFREDQTRLHPRPIWKTIVKELALRLLFSQGRALYVSSNNRDWFAHYGVPRDRLFFTPYCVDNTYFVGEAQRLGPTRDSTRTAFGLDRSTPVILMVSRLIEKKQPLATLRAFALARRQQECALLVVGSGPMEAAMRAFVMRERLDGVVFAGFLNRSQIATAYSVADVFVLFSREHETFGMVVEEAMNFSLPVVVSNKVGCARDLVRDGENGFVVEREDVGGLATRLVRLVESVELRKRMGARSAQLVQSWNYRAAADGLLAAVRASVGERRWSEAEGSQVSPLAANRARPH